MFSGPFIAFVKTGAPKIADPRGRSLAWEKASTQELAKRLHDARPYVRQRAKESLAQRGPALSRTGRSPIHIRQREQKRLEPRQARSGLGRSSAIDDARARPLVRSA